MLDNTKYNSWRKRTQNIKVTRKAKKQKKKKTKPLWFSTGDSAELHLPSRIPMFFPLKERKGKILRVHEEPDDSGWLRKEHRLQNCITIKTKVTIKFKIQASVKIEFMKFNRVKS